MKITRWLFVLCMLVHSVAWAQSEAEVSDDTRAKASAHFQRGVALFREQAYRASLVEFQRAYDIAPDYRLLYNIAQAKIEVHDYLGAAESYERYLEEGSLDISEERRVEVTEALAALRERVASLQIVVNVQDADVFIDDVKVGTSPLATPVRVNIGGHRVSARTAYGATDTKVVEVAGGDVVQVALALAAPARPVVVAPPPEPPPQSWNRTERAGIAAFSVAGVLAVSALTTGLLAAREQNDYDKLLKTPDLSRKELLDQRHLTHRLAVTTDVLAATALASALAGTLCWVLGHDDTQKEAAQRRASVRLRVSAGLGSLSLHGAF
jgi:tetratricopeptide (TPR) repeat protein